MSAGCSHCRKAIAVWPRQHLRSAAALLCRVRPQGHRAAAAHAAVINVPPLQGMKQSAEEKAARKTMSDQRALFEWLRERGVPRSGAKKFIDDTHCTTTHEAAVYLRFQLAPLHLANDDNVNGDMKRLMGCSPKAALKVLSDLDVFSALPAPLRSCAAPTL